MPEMASPEPPPLLPGRSWGPCACLASDAAGREHEVFVKPLVKNDH